MTESESTPKPKHKGRAAKICGLAATALWVVGFILVVVVPPRSTFFWVSDFLLLIGFWPLLWLWRPGWPWIVFGLLNMFIGFFLEVAYVLPDHIYTDAAEQLPALKALSHNGASIAKDMMLVRDHLRDSHSALTWIIVGFISVVLGIVRTTKNLIVWFAKKRASQ